MFHKAEFLSVQEAQYNNNEYLRVPNLHRPEALAHSLQEVHIVKIQCIQHEHTHTQTHTRMHAHAYTCLLYTSPSPRDEESSRMPSSA